MIQREQDQPEEYLQDRRAEVDEQLWNALLNGQRIEKAVDEFGRVHIRHRFHAQARNAEGKLKSRAGENAPLQGFGHGQLHDGQKAVERNADGDDADEQIQRSRGLPARQ